VGDLDQPATVFWAPEPPHTGVPAIDKKRFRTLRDALKFVNKDSDPHMRRRVQVVTSEGQFLALADIERRYRACRGEGANRS